MDLYVYVDNILVRINSIYITESTTVDKINVTVGTYVKELKNDIDTDYKNSSNVMEGEKYKYTGVISNVYEAAEQ